MTNAQNEFNGGQEANNDSRPGGKKRLADFRGALLARGTSIGLEDLLSIGREHGFDLQHEMHDDSENGTHMITCLGAFEPGKYDAIAMTGELGNAVQLAVQHILNHDEIAGEEVISPIAGFRALCDYFASLQNFGITLPEGKQPEGFLKLSAEELRKYAESVYTNDKFWDGLTDSLEIQPDQRKDLILMALHGKQFLEDANRRADETADSESLERYLSEEFSSDDANQFEEAFGEFKKNLWRKTGKKTIRNELLDILKKYFGSEV